MSNLSNWDIRYQHLHFSTKPQFPGSVRLGLSKLNGWSSYLVSSLTVNERKWLIFSSVLWSGLVCTCWTAVATWKTYKKVIKMIPSWWFITPIIPTKPTISEKKKNTLTLVKLERRLTYLEEPSWGRQGWSSCCSGWSRRPRRTWCSPPPSDPGSPARRPAGGTMRLVLTSNIHRLWGSIGLMNFTWVNFKFRTFLSTIISPGQTDKKPVFLRKIIY